MQAIATGQLKSLEQAREVVGNSFELKGYQPADGQKWQRQYAKIESIFDI